MVENYGEYMDYNSTTTQSDSGEMLYTLLDFLRVQTSYHRVAWNLRPVIVAHELLVRHGRQAAAEIWRAAVVRRTEDAAASHLAAFRAVFPSSTACDCPALPSAWKSASCGR